MASSLPVAAKERIDSVDILRGFALFGILLINITAFKSPGAPPGLGVQSDWLNETVLFTIVAFIESKFFTLFSFLFGLGFSIQFVRAQEKGANFVRRFKRRLLALLAFGVLHIVFLWDGDILLLYSITGFILLTFRNKTPRNLRRWAVGLLVTMTSIVGLLVGALQIASYLPSTRATLESLTKEVAQEFAKTRAELTQEYANGSYSELLRDRVSGYATTLPLLITRIPTVLAMFLLGLYVGRRDILRRVGEHLPLLRKVRRWGLGIGVPLSLLIATAYTTLPIFSGLSLLFFNQTLAGPLLSMGYAASLVLLLQRESWQRLLSPLARSGRMALTNYLSQSLVCALLFNGYGLGLAGKVTPVAAMLIAVVIYALQMLFSGLWLRYFRFGPLEWLWRCLTYGQWQPIRYRSQRSLAGE